VLTTPEPAACDTGVSMRCSMQDNASDMLVFVFSRRPELVGSHIHPNEYGFALVFISVWMNMRLKQSLRTKMIHFLSSGTEMIHPHKFDIQ
jgi:hypothetical protein